MRGNELVNGCKVRAYDNGGRSADRYTVVFMDLIDERTKNHYRPLYTCLGMSDRPFHPQGVGMYGEACIGTHLGKRVRIADLPAECIRAVTQDCTE